MQLTGMLHGARLLQFAGFPTPEVLGPAATEDEIKDLISRHGEILIKPVFKGGVGKKGKAGLIGRATDLATALQEKERLYFAEHKVGDIVTKANGVTFEAVVPAEHEVYFSLTDSTHFRAPTMTLTHHGGVAIEELDKSLVAQVPFEALTGMKAFIVANALSSLDAPTQIVSPLVQHLPNLWELFHEFGMTTLELNPIRMRPERRGRLTPVACDFKCGFDRDDPRVARLGLSRALFSVNYTDFEHEVNQLRTYQGQSDVYVINPNGTILAPTFGGGANSLVSEMLGDSAIISSDFGGNPPYEKMKELSRILLPLLARADQRAVHHRRQGQQHRHLRDLPGHGGRAARALRAPTAPRRCMPSSGAAGPTSSGGWGRCATPSRRCGSPTRCSASTPT